MDNFIKWQENILPKADNKKSLEFLSNNEISKAREFHKSFPQYSETPLANLKGLASKSD